MKKMLLSIAMLTTSGMLLGAAKPDIKFIVHNNTSEDFYLQIAGSHLVRAGEKVRLYTPSLTFKKFTEKPIVLQFKTSTVPTTVTRTFTVQPPKGGWLKAKGDSANEEDLFVNTVSSYPGIAVSFRSSQIEELYINENASGTELEK